MLVPVYVPLLAATAIPVSATAAITVSAATRANVRFEQPICLPPLRFCSALQAQPRSVATAASATWVGVRPTVTPFAVSACSLATAVPCEPETIAPA